MESIGEYLKREREFRKISLEEISRTTKIREDMLRDIEENRLDSLPSPVFVKGFLRAYARCVGLDPDDVVLRYETPHVEEEDLPVERAAPDTPKQWRLKYIVLPVSLLLLLGVLLFLALHRPTLTEKEAQQMVEPVTKSLSQGESDQPGVREDADSAILPDSDRKELPVSSPPMHPSRPVTSSLSEPPSGIELQLAALEDAWIQIQVDHGPAEEILLRPGEIISRRGERNIEMKIGNAGGLEILHNGRNLGKLGESGKVVYLSITPEEAKVRRSPSPLAPIP